MELYGLRHLPSGKYLTIGATYECFYDEDEKPEDIEVVFTLGIDCSQTIWTTPNLIRATFVRSVSSQVFNATADTPQHKFRAEDLEVVNMVSGQTIMVRLCPSTYEVLSKIKGLHKFFPILLTEEMKHTKTYTERQYREYLEIIDNKST